LLNFFKKKTNVEKSGKDSTIDAVDLTGQDQGATADLIETELSYHTDWNVSQEQEYAFRYLNNELEPLKSNQISIAGVELRTIEEGIEVTAIVRSSLDKAFQLERAELLLMSTDEQVIGRKEFDLAELGVLPARSSRPWIFTFEHETLPQFDQLDRTNWKLAFNVASMQDHQLDLDDAWKDSLSEEAIEKLKNVVRDLPKPKTKEINFTGLNANYQDDGGFTATLLIRNGYHHSVTLEQLPLTVLDHKNEAVAKGVFKLNLTIHANTTKPWTFQFPKELVLDSNADLSSWRVVANA
jgi:accessory Sec system S-layer assembly protein